MRWAGLAALLAAGIAQAQPSAPTRTQNIVPMAPNAIVTPSCEFASWTLTAAGTANVSLIGPAAKADATPQAILVAGPTRTGNVIAVQVSPDQGCAAPGCRNGNSYLVELRPEAGSDRPVCVLRIDVRKVVS